MVDVLGAVCSWLPCWWGCPPASGIDPDPWRDRPSDDTDLACSGMELLTLKFVFVCEPCCTMSAVQRQSVVLDLGTRVYGLEVTCSSRLRDPGRRLPESVREACASSSSPTAMGSNMNGRDSTPMRACKRRCTDGRL